MFFEHLYDLLKETVMGLPPNKRPPVLYRNAWIASKRLEPAFAEERRIR